MEKGCQRRVNRRRAPDSFQIDFAGKMHGSHWLVVFGPDAFQRLRCQIAGDRPRCFMTFQMPQQEALMARSLPDQMQPIPFCQRFDLRIPLRFYAPLIPIQQNRPKSKSSALGLYLFDSPNRQLNKRKWIAAAGVQHIVIDMEVQTGCLGNLAQARGIALLALPLATEIDARSLLNPQPDHPIRGTAPYTPPRYFW